VLLQRDGDERKKHEADEIGDRLLAAVHASLPCSGNMNP
jgi:hypothetical protein